MNPITGNNVTIQFLKGDAYYDYACATDITIDFVLDEKPVRTYGDGTWYKPRGQRHSYSISLSGLVVFDEPTLPGAFDLLEYLRAMSGIQYRIFFDEPITSTLKLIEGIALPINVTLGGAAEGFAQGNIELKGDGNVSIRDAIINCPSEVLTIALNDAQTAILITGHTGEPVRYDYGIDGGGLDTAYIFTDPAELDLPDDIAIGVHTIQIFPVCENGDYGTEFNGSFEIEEVVEPGVCSPPTALNFSDVTENGATAQWDQLGDPPADGYEWEIVDEATSGATYSDSGTTTDTSVGLTGLAEGVEYRFRVRSACGEGEFSAWVEDTFTTEVVSETATFDWSYIELFSGNGALQVIGDVSGIILIQTVSDNDTFIVDPIQQLTIRCNGNTGSSRQLWVVDETIGSTLYNNTDTTNQEFIFTPTAGHLYSIFARVIFTP
jgi:hypothetical protein